MSTIYQEPYVVLQLWECLSTCWWFQCWLVQMGSHVRQLGMSFPTPPWTTDTQFWVFQNWNSGLDWNNVIFNNKKYYISSKKYGKSFHKQQERFEKKSTNIEPVMPSEIIELVQYWLKWWLLVWWHQAITPNNLTYQQICSWYQSQKFSWKFNFLRKYKIYFSVTWKKNSWHVGLKKNWCINSSDAGDQIFRIWGSISGQLMLWLLKSPVHQQAWYWLCRKNNMYCYSRDNFNDLGQAKSKIWFKMWIYLL